MVAVGVVAVAEHEVERQGLAGLVDVLDVVQQPVERLALADLGLEVAHQVVALVGLAHLVGLLVHLQGDALVLVVEVVVIDGELFRGGDRTQGEVGLDRVHRLAAQALDEGGAVLAGGGEELVHVHALGLELAHGRVDAVAQVAVDERVGRLDVGERRERRGDLADEVAAHLGGLVRRDVVADVGRPRLDGVDVGVVVGDPLVGELGRHQLLDARDGDGEVGRLGLCPWAWW